MNQDNRDNAKGWQTNAENSTLYNAENITINHQLNHQPKKTIKPVKYIPPQGAKNFIGRSQELAKIHSLLYKQKHTVAISAVGGMGGIGKTELAIKYAHQYQDYYTGGICWLYAASGNLATEIIQFAQTYLELKVPQKDIKGNPLGINQQVAWCWQNWQPSDGLVLVIFDDVDNKENWSTLLPKNDRFRVLATTRLESFDGNIRKIALDVFSLDEALEILINMVGSRKVNRELETAKELCKLFNYLPLGVELAGRYIDNKPPHVTLADILKELKQQQTQSAKNSLQKNIIEAQSTVKAAFELSWLQLSEQTQKIAAILSLFTENIFAWSWVESIANSLNFHQDNVGEALEQLYQRHLVSAIEEEDTYYYKLHPLICEFLREKLAGFAEADELKRAFVNHFIAVAKKIPKSATLEDIAKVKNAVPHLAEIAENLIENVSDEDLYWAFVGLNRFYNAQGLYELALPWSEQFVSVVKSRLGENHPDYAQSLNNLANLYYDQGKYDEAEPLYREALSLRKRILGENHPDYAQSLNNLANLYYDQGKYDEAEPLYRETLSLRKRILGENHPDYAQSLNNLASLYYNQGKYDEAEPLYRQALELYKRILGENHPDYAQSLNNLASLYRSQGKYDEAEPLYRQALELRKRILGENHPDYAQSLNNLASLYRSQGKYDEAEPLYRQALELRKRILGENHPDYAQSLNNLASLYRSQGKYDEAEPLYRQALELKKRILGENHPSYATSLNNLAFLYRSQGKYDEAEPLYRQALDIYEQRLGSNHPYTNNCRRNLENLRSKMNSNNSTQ
ncbi:MAG: tetratricopeptide repeat protein [Scytonematopsis contorta HA4267-MV1]|nr:tetratricopeptide repeat protein [Scytonematopsis contorta HA4267-MV1]